MSRHWREQLDPARHRDFMSWCNEGGVPATAPKDSLIEAWAYFVEVCGFRFEFVSLDQLRECLDWFSQDHHGPNRNPDASSEHYWQRWYERLPKGLLAEPKRQKVIKALQHALSEFDAYRA